jgi:NAD(P)-dependent dehydrogenase (short-subunit alcohol dehydrogenase family)
MINIVDLTGKNIVITGASSGIGLSAAILCSQLGAKVSIIGRNEERLNDTMNLLKGTNHLLFPMDVTNYSQIDVVISKIVDANGKIDGFIHSAGIEMTKPLKILKPEMFEDVFAVNVFSGFAFAKAISKNKNINSGASLIFIASIVGSFGQAGKIAYSSSKGALISGCKSMALEFASKGIRVNTISPALVETEMSKKIMDTIGEESKANILKMHPLGLGKVEDVANACAFFLSDASYWITGTDFIIDGGYSAS